MKYTEKPIDGKLELSDEVMDQITGGAMIVNHNQAAINTLNQLNQKRDRFRGP